MPAAVAFGLHGDVFASSGKKVFEKHSYLLRLSDLGVEKIIVPIICSLPRILVTLKVAVGTATLFLRLKVDA